MLKVGKAQPVSKMGAAPTGASSFPSWSKHTVAILYVSSLSMLRRPSECPSEDLEDEEDPAEKPMPSLRCICSWSTAMPR